MANGTRTRDNRDHNPVLYQLSYDHHDVCAAVVACRAGKTRSGGMIGPEGARTSWGVDAGMCLEQVAKGAA